MHVSFLVHQIRLLPSARLHNWRAEARNPVETRTNKQWKIIFFTLSSFNASNLFRLRPFKKKKNNPSETLLLEKEAPITEIQDFCDEA